MSQWQQRHISFSGNILRNSSGVTGVTSQENLSENTNLNSILICIRLSVKILILFVGIQHQIININQDNSPKTMFIISITLMTLIPNQTRVLHMFPHALSDRIWRLSLGLEEAPFCFAVILELLQLLRQLLGLGAWKFQRPAPGNKKKSGWIIAWRDWRMLWWLQHTSTYA